LTRDPRLFGPDDLVWDFFSRPRDEPLIDRVLPATKAGFAGMGVFVGAWASLRNQPDQLELFDNALAQSDLAVVNIEALRGWASPDGPNEACLNAEALAWELADRYGCRYVQVIGDYTGSIAEAAAGFGALCDRASEHGLIVGLEAVPEMTNIDTLPLARQIIETADRPNGGFCFDSWHLTRSSSNLDDVRAFDAAHIVATQWNDGPLSPLVDDYYTDTLTTRLAPGRGEFALVEMVQTLDAMGVAAPTGLEVPSTAFWEAPAVEAAAAVATAMRDLRSLALSTPPSASTSQ